MDPNITALELQEGINSKDISRVEQSINTLIRFGVPVAIKYSNIYRCSSHMYICNGYGNEFLRESLLQSYQCERGHLMCSYCLVTFLEPIIKKRGFERFECVACFHQGLPNSLLFDDSYYHQYLHNLFGPEKYQEFTGDTETQERAKINLYAPCSSCNSGYHITFKSCLNDHLLCKTCMISFISQGAQSQDYKCLIASCNLNLLHESIKFLLVNDESLLSQVWDKLRSPGFKYCKCPSCNLMIEIDVKTTSHECSKCQTSICSRCANITHEGSSCYNVQKPIKDAIFFDLPKPAHGAPTNMYEEEYVNAKYAFDQFIVQNDTWVTNVKLIVNPDLESKYEQKKKDLIKIDPKYGNERYVFHASKFVNYEKICGSGFKIGGVDDIGISNGAVHGLGVYTATSPDFSLNYVENGKDWMLICKVLPGKDGPAINNLEEFKQATYHSHLTRSGGSSFDNILVLFTKEQVLPKYLVEFAKRK